MKKVLFLLMAVALIGFTGCSKDDAPSDVTLTYQAVTDVPGISFAGNTMNAPYTGVTVVIPITDATGNKIEGVALSATASDNSTTDEWCTPTIEGSALKLVIKTNPNTDNGRRVKITVSSTASHIKPLELTIAQTAYVLRAAGMYILSEGTATKSGALSYYDFESEEHLVDYFKTQNGGASLGNMANSGLIYGSKLYVAIDKSNKVSVIDATTGILIKDIDMGQVAGADCEPRFLASHGGNVYVSAYLGGITKIDTIQYNVQKTAISGTYSEGLCVLDNNLYVANSGWGMGKTISIIDLATFKETGTIDTPVNPYVLKTGTTGELYLVTLGDYYETDAQLHKVDPITKKVTTYDQVIASRFDIYGDYAYTSHFSYLDYSTYIKKVNLKTGETVDFLKDEDLVSVNVYGVNVNPLTGDVFYTEMSGLVSCFDQEGNLKYTLKNNGTYVNSVIFRNK